MELFYVILGSAMLYSVVHFAIIQHSKNWLNRSKYERFITVFALIATGLLILGVMMGE